MNDAFKKNILVYAYGNPARQDDCLGEALINNMESWLTENKQLPVTLDANYQLNIEDAANIAGYDIVVFADASMESDVHDFLFTRVKASPKTEFSSHAASAEFILHLCNQIYDKYPDTFLLHIKGYAWEFNEKPTDAAMANLEKATSALKEMILHPERFDAID